MIACTFLMGAAFVGIFGSILILSTACAIGIVVSARRESDR